MPNLQITCFSLGSLLSRWNVALVSRYGLRSVLELCYLLELGVTGARHDVSKNFVEAALHLIILYKLIHSDSVRGFGVLGFWGDRKSVV